MKTSDFVKPLKKLAKTSHARLSKVACFFIKNGAIISSGVNYNPTGEPMETEIDGKLVTQPEVIHAEIAAITAARENKVDLTNSTLFLTMSPCLSCARVIAKLHICELNYLYEWWDAAALDLLRENHIEIKQIKEEK